MNRWIFIIMFGAVYFLFTSFRIDTARKEAEAYIDQYKAICIEEMQRTGIPASIKLAQGMLESDLGRSPLAVNARNHFGIKCGKDWEGGSFFKVDDDTDAEGNVIESCFRKFSEPEESFMAHSAFLLNPAKQKRYGFLFKIPTTDYVLWAKGLKEAGYATDPGYPAKLIRIIEEYDLHAFDTETKPTSAQHEVTQQEINRRSNTKGSGPTVTGTKVLQQRYLVTLINGLRAVHAAGGESVQQVALSTNSDVYALLEFNEGCDSPSTVLATDAIIFLERKKKSPQDPLLTFHVADGKESLFDIAQKYGIRLQCLVDRNGITEQSIPREGSQVILWNSMTKQTVPAYKYP